MAFLYCEFHDGIGRPCRGSVTLAPSDRGPDLSSGVTMLGGSRVVLVLDVNGRIEANVEGGNYRVSIRLAGADTVTREISVPAGGSVNLRWLLAGPTATPGETSEAFTVAGPYTYHVPWWSTHIDLVLYPGGGGGDNGGPSTAGRGGGAGAIETRTLARGVDIPWDSTIISGTVGAGGAPHAGNGTATTAGAPGLAVLSAPGGTGGASDSSTGASPGDVTFNGVLHKGGAPQPTKGAPGNGPGGGGAGGNTGSQPGGAGADGAAYLRAYQ